MNKHEELKEENEIDSYELNDEDFNNYNQYPRNSLMDRYGNESPVEMDPALLKNRKPSTGWLVDAQERLPSPKMNETPAEKEDDETFITELDVNSSDLISLQERRLSQERKESESYSKPNKRRASKNKSSILNELPTLVDYQEDNETEYLPYHLSKNVLSLEQLDNITKKDSTSLFMLDNINLSLLSKYLIKETNSNQLEPDVSWTFDGLLTEMSDYFKN